MPENKYLQKFDIIVKAFSAADRIALFHDLDADGISSGALAYSAIMILRGTPPDLIITQPFKTVELLPKSLGLLRANKITKLVAVDSALDQKPESIREAENIISQTLIIDHHKKYADVQSSKTFVIKPQDFSEIEPSRYPCAKLVYDLFSRHVDLRAYSWIAGVGLLGDCQGKEWAVFLDAVAKAHNSSIRELEKIVDIISAVEVLEPDKLQELLLLIADSKKPSEVIKSKFAGYAAELEKKTRALLAEFKSKKEVFANECLIWFEFKAMYNIKSPVINEASHRLYPDKTLIFVQDKGDGFLSFSCRNQSFRVKTNELLENAVKGLENASAGGHIPASAGRIMKKDLPEFKRRVIQLLRFGKDS